MTWRSLHRLRHSIAVHILEASQGIEYVADHLGHKNIQNTRIYAQITTSLRQEVFAKLEHHPKIVRILWDASHRQWCDSSSLIWRLPYLPVSRCLLFSLNLSW